MDKIVDCTAQIARRVRLERDARGWSQAELAERSGVAKATISKIEREAVSPTAVILVRLASAFGMTLAGLLVRAEAASGQVTRRADQATWRDPETGYQRVQIFNRLDHPVEIARIELPPGRTVVFPVLSYARIQQVVWVMQGELVIVHGKDRYALSAGDCLGFGPPVDVAFYNETTVPCSYLVVLARS
jgi:transcriptional regulator with XRE-family HTH domain